MRVLVVGGAAREQAIATALAQAEADVVVASTNLNPGIERMAKGSYRVDVADPAAVARVARNSRVDLAVIGPEAPLARGVADALRALNVPTVGPSKDAARIETSKEFCRALLAKHSIDASPRFRAVHQSEEIDGALRDFSGQFVVKAIGLAGGKGVAVQGRDFMTTTEGIARAKEMLAAGQPGVVIEEKLEGEEFSLMAFVTDSGVYPMPCVQDYKRALEGDQGANTGGMGAYSQRDHLLPFLSRAASDQATAILRKVADGLRADGLAYRGILYGGFMLTRDGPKVLELNARFGDPEGINVLSLYEEGDFAELMLGVANGHVDPNLVRFRLRATVAKYLVPLGYGTQPKAGGVLRVDEPSIEALGVKVVYGSVEAAGPSQVRLSTSRGVALVGEASAIHEASSRVEAALPFVTGDYYVRHDIGSKDDVKRRTEHMRTILDPTAKPSPLPLSVAPPNAPPSSAGPADLLL